MDYSSVSKSRNKAMKFLFSLFLMCAIWCGAAAQDTICLPSERIARIADTIAHLRQFQVYSVKCDSALSSCKEWGLAMESKNELIFQQLDGAKRAGELVAQQLGMQKSVSKEWEDKALALDKKLQKQKRIRNTIAGVLGGGLLGASGAIIGIILK